MGFSAIALITIPAIMGMGLMQITHNRIACLLGNDRGGGNR
jgi:hypothetical protein